MTEQEEIIGRNENGREMKKKRGVREREIECMWVFMSYSCVLVNGKLSGHT